MEGKVCQTGLWTNAVETARTGQESEKREQASAIVLVSTAISYRYRYEVLSKEMRVQTRNLMDQRREESSCWNQTSWP